MKTPEEMRDHLIAKAGTDEAFREKLLSDPHTLIEAEFNITIPEGLSVQVHENSAKTVHLLLPQAVELSEKELSKTTGGSTSGWCTY